MKNCGSVFLAFLWIFLAGCSGSLSKESAAAKLDEAFRDSEPVFFLDVGRVGSKCGDAPGDAFMSQDPSHDFQFIAAAKLGLVTIEPETSDVWKVELTDAGKDASKDHKGKSFRTNKCDYQLVGFPLGRKSPVSVTGITPVDDQTVRVNYTWSWIPNDLARKIAGSLSPAEITELKRSLKARGLGQSFYVPDGTQSATETSTQKFRKSDSGWQMSD